MKLNYDCLGNHIKLVDCRNKENITNRVLGINIDKYFMPSVANVIGTDLSKYKIITKGKFACNPMHVGRDERLPIALYGEEEPAIVSPAYFMFEIIDNNILNEEYLMMWFRRPEFDRICWLHTDGSVRGGITWDDICRMELPLPSIDKQLKIVASYKAITNRIALKQKINDNLEAQILSLFTEKFSYFIKSKSDLPAGWISDEAQNIFDITIGKTPPRERTDCFTKDASDIKWISISDMGSNGMYILDTSEHLTLAAIKEFNIKLVPANTVIYSFKMTNGRTALTTEECTTNEAIAHFKTTNINLTYYAYCYLSTFRFSDLGSTSSITEAVNSKIIKAMPFYIPPEKDLNAFVNIVKPLFESIKLNSAELRSLKCASDIFLALLSR